MVFLLPGLLPGWRPSPLRRYLTADVSQIRREACFMITNTFVQNFTKKESPKPVAVEIYGVSPILPSACCGFCKDTWYPPIVRTNPGQRHPSLALPGTARDAGADARGCGRGEAWGCPPIPSATVWPCPAPLATLLYPLPRGGRLVCGTALFYSRMLHPSV